MPATDTRKRTAVDLARGATTFKADPEDLTIISDKNSPRYDERAELPVDAGLVASINSLGVLKPVLVCKNGDTIEVLDGRQRVKAAREVNKIRRSQGGEPIMVPVIVRSASDDAAAYFVQASANIHLPDPPLLKARKAAHMRTVLGKSDDEIATAFGVTVPAVRAWSRLLDCIPAVQRAVEAGTVSVREAAAMAALPREAQAAELAKVGERREKGVGGGGGPAKAGKTKSGRPTTAVIRKLHGHAFEADPLHPQARALLGWIAGKVTRGELLQAAPGLAPALAKAT